MNSIKVIKSGLDVSKVIQQLTVNIEDEERITFVFDVPHSPDNPQHNIDGQS